MKKLIYGLAAVAFAAMMVACGSNDPYKVGVSKGNKSQMDSLSYAFGVSIAHDINYNIPEMKFDWKTLINTAEDSMLESTPYEEDEKIQEHIQVLEQFFSVKRPERIKKFLAENKPDSVERMHPQEEHALLAQLDIFENEEERQSVSEAYGYDLGARYRAIRIPIQAYWFAQGAADFMINSGGSKILTDEASNIIMTYQLNKMPKINKEASAAWLAKVEKQKGVQKSESGLLYRIDKEGDADIKPTAKCSVKAHYEGKLRDGVVFDSSYERGEPAEFRLSGVIQGWTEGLQYIGKGGQITLWIPSELAYGEGMAGIIGPNEALEFKVELVDVIPAPAPAPVEAQKVE
ncbi:MAG: FKBP-type peptidyl-prolyl cis-trans isomerase [Alistipes sp.]|nr:FKBP-type peptidyl-prolyl cis-trans isomerase [Alistipes sp.]